MQWSINIDVYGSSGISGRFEGLSFSLKEKEPMKLQVKGYVCFFFFLRKRTYQSLCLCFFFSKRKRTLERFRSGHTEQSVIINNWFTRIYWDVLGKRGGYYKIPPPPGLRIPDSLELRDSSDRPVYVLVLLLVPTPWLLRSSRVRCHSTLSRFLGLQVPVIRRSLRFVFRTNSLHSS
jgi:hypothetical protein